MRQLALIVLACHPAVDREEVTPVAIHCASPTREDVEMHATVRGRIAAPPGADLPVASQAAGRILTLSVKEGQQVAANQVIATIDDLTSGPAANTAVANVEQAKSAVANADGTLARTKELFSRGFVAKQELDDAQARADQAHAQLAAASAGSDLALRTLSRVTVRTSFAGIVTKILRGPGALVDGTNNTPIVQVAATNATELHADASPQSLEAIKEGQPAEIKLATGGVIKGVVRSSPATLDPKTGLGLVRIGITEGSPMLGAFASATIALGKREKVLIIPASAMRGAALDGSEVVLCKGAVAEVKVITIGWRDNDRVEVASGLTETDTIAIDHVLALENETPIKVEHP